MGASLEQAERPRGGLIRTSNMQPTTKFYTVVTFGAPARRLASLYPSEERATSAARTAKGSGSCSAARVYECDTAQLARTADISEVRAGERVIATI